METLLGRPLEVEVRDSIEKAMKILKQKMSKEGILQEIKRRRYYEKPSVKKKRKMREARITVSSIAVGPAADQELLKNIAGWGQGREYMVADAHELPLEVTRLGRRHASEPVIQQTNPRGEPIYWIGPAGDAREAGPGTDFHATSNGEVSITPLHVDLTDHATLPAWRAWAGRAAG